MKRFLGAALTAAAIAATGPAPLDAQDSTAKTSITYAEVLPVLEAIREELVPADLKTKTEPELEIVWPRWLSARDGAIRDRVAEGDEDSIVNFLFFGTTFTTRPRPTAQDLTGLVASPAAALEALRPRVDDFLAGVASPGGNERLQFARQRLAQKGMDVGTPAGREQARQYLEKRMQAVGAGAAARSSLTDAAPVTASTLYRDRGLSSDTSVAIDFGIDRALEALKTKGVIRPAAVRRVAIVGPGLDFTDKLEGYDFYPQQTIQPFAVIDSLVRHGLSAADLQVVALDLSPRVVQHIAAARGRAAAGAAYGLVLPRNSERAWTPDLVAYWQRLGDRIGEPGTPPAAPASAGPVAVRSVTVRPAIVSAVSSQDVNIVLERLAPDSFDLIVATNILVYYDVFEQSLAAINVAKMLRPGGVFLTNTRITEVPGVPLRAVGYTDAVYTSAPGAGDTGDRILWYQR